MRRRMERALADGFVGSGEWSSFLGEDISYRFLLNSKYLWLCFSNSLVALK